MNIPNKSRLLWTARILAIVYVLFVSLFALDVESKMSFARQLTAFIIHLSPALVILIMLLIYWNHPLYSGIVFLILAAAFTLFFSTYSNLTSFLILSLPLLAIGVIFIFSHLSSQCRSSN